MKLERILDKLGAFDKNSFIKIIDGIVCNNPKNFKKIEEILSSVDTTKGLKSADNSNIVNIFNLVIDEFLNHIKISFQDINSQFDILIDLLIKDGGCINKLDWFSRRYDEAIKDLKIKVKELNSDKSTISEQRIRDYNIYKSCLHTAYNNDLENNLDSKISSDELSIILTLSKGLGLSQEEIRLINYSILPLKKLEIADIIKNLKNIGVIFFSSKENTIYVADEIIILLRKIRQKEVAEKYFRRTLRLLKDPIINLIARHHNIDRKLSTASKIESIIKEGVSFSDLLINDIHKEGTSLNEKKKVITEIYNNGLGISNLKGSTIEEKIDSLVKHFEALEKEEKINISIDGYGKLLSDLNNTLPKLNNQLREHFQMQKEFVMNVNLLLDYNLKPRDILDLISKEDLMAFVKKNGIKQRGDEIINILSQYRDVENLYLENYVNVGLRNLNELKENGINIKEADLGVKFEDLTKKIFRGLGFSVDMNLKKKISTKKDIPDILINFDSEGIMIIECKTNKAGNYNKFSSVSRQLKSYKNLALKHNLRIIKILLVAPNFADDFINDCALDTEINLSLITASTLLNIFKAFKNTNHQKFPHLLLLKDTVINEDRIIRALKK